MRRQIIKIDEKKCNGCGLCVNACAEEAIQIVDGKARLISEKYCDGLGACLGECPEGAITIEEREAEGFSKEAVEKHLKTKTDSLPCGCPSTKEMHWEADTTISESSTSSISLLSQWPVKIALVSPQATCFDSANLLITADCVPFAYSNFHQDFLKGKAIVIGCPKLDVQGFYLQKLIEIFRQSDLKGIKVIHMEVPCCFELYHIAKTALNKSSKDIPLEQIIISIKGERK